MRWWAARSPPCSPRNGILKSSPSSATDAKLHRSPAALSLLVSDDGQGATAYDGFGLRGMRERLRLLGGSLEVTGGNGTQLHASLPQS